MLYQLIVYVPAGDAENLKEALFAAGAGKYENRQFKFKVQHIGI